MKIALWLGNGWFLFSGLMAGVILVFLAMPSLFGFQNFVQWGAMYDDRWCTVMGFESSPHLASNSPRSESVVPGKDAQRVYSAPTHNYDSCLAWSRLRCGKQAKEGWTVQWVEPEFRGVRYMGAVNVCDLELPSLDFWFSDGQ